MFSLLKRGLTFRRFCSISQRITLKPLNDCAASSPTRFSHSRNRQESATTMRSFFRDNNRFWNIYSYVVCYAWERRPIQIIAVVHGARNLAVFFSLRTGEETSE